MMHLDVDSDFSDSLIKFEHLVKLVGSLIQECIHLGYWILVLDILP